MAARKSKKISIVNVLVYALLLLLVVGLVGACVYFTNGFTEDFKSFYITYNDNMFVKADNQVSLTCGELSRFDCKYTFSGVMKDPPKGYSVKIVPNVTDETNFEYTVDGKTKSFAEEKDLTAAFNIEKNDTYFTVLLPAGFDMQAVLSSLYDGQNVIVPDEIIARNDYFYTMLISSYNDQLTYKFSFNLFVPVTEIIFDKESIIF